MTRRLRTLIIGLALAAATVPTASAAFAAPAAGGHGATVIDCGTLSGGVVRGVAVVAPGGQTVHGDPACIAWLNSSF